jgi:sec-independent protein translocase protein TatA
MGNLGPWEIALIVLAVLLVFGPKQLPKIGRSLGGGMREFKDSVTEPAREIREAVDTPKELLSFNPKKDIEDALNPFAEQEEEDEAEALDGEIVEPAGADAQATAAPAEPEAPAAAEPEAPAVAEPVAVAAEQPPAEAPEPAPASTEKT